MLYVHIGLHKTGSTFLQFCLDSNRERLAELGYCYPKVDPEALAPYQHVSLVLGLATGDTRAAEQVVAEGFSGARHVVLSAERFTMASFKHGETLGRWLDTVRGSGHDVRAIVYVRRQDLYAQSLYRHVVRAPESRVALTFQEFIEQRPPRLDYEKLLTPWARIVGRDNLVVRPYERGQWRNGDLLSDFLGILGIDGPAGFAIPDTRANRGFSTPLIEFMRRTNPARDEEAQRRLIELLEKALPPGTLYEESGSSYLSPDEERAFLGRFAASNRRLAEQWLGRADGVLFREALVPDDRRPDLSDEAVERVRQLVREGIGRLNLEAAEMQQLNI